MKKIFILFLLTIIITSCNSPYKKRKRCKGNGSWYGNRNLGYQNPNPENTYSLTDLKP